MDRAAEEGGSKSVTAWLPFAYSLGYCSLQGVSEKICVPQMVRLDETFTTDLIEFLL